jgi:hypothetical protein
MLDGISFILQSGSITVELVESVSTKPHIRMLQQRMIKAFLDIFTMCLMMVLAPINITKDYFNISSFFINHLPEESQGYLLDLRKRWQRSSQSSFLVALKTMHFWFRHWRCDICSEVGKRVQKAFPSRWI